MSASFVLLLFISLCCLLRAALSYPPIESSLHSCDLTEYEQPFQSLIKRRKRRGIIFPKGSSIVVTQAITKVMTGATPRGLSVSYELDIYFPLPDTLEGLYSKKILNQLEAISRIDPSNNEIHNHTSNYLFPSSLSYGYKNHWVKKVVNTTTRS